MSGESVTTWIGKLRNGEQEVAQQLWERYFRRLVTLARDKLRAAPRRVADEEDVALSAFETFCRAVANDRLPRLYSRDDLWQLLVMLTARKAVKQMRYQSRQKRGGRSQPLGNEMLDQVVGEEPSPEFALMVSEEYERLLALLQHEDMKVIALRKMEGYTNTEIAQQLNCSLRTIMRKLSLIRDIWSQEAPA